MNRLDWLSVFSQAQRGLRRWRKNFVLQLSGILLAMSLLPLLTYYVVSYQATLQSILDTATHHNLEVLGYQRDYLMLLMDQIEGLAANLGQIEEISRSLSTINSAERKASAAGIAGAADSSMYDRLATKARIGYLLSNYRNLNGLVSIDLFALNGSSFHVGDSLLTAQQRTELRDELMARTFRAKDSVVWHGVEDNVHIDSTATKVLSASKLLLRPDSSWLKTEPVGMLLMNYSTDYLYDHFSGINLGEGAYFLVVDEEQRLMYHPEKNRIGANVASDFAKLLQGDSGSFIQRLGEQDVLLSYIQVPNKKWFIVSIVPKYTLMKPMLPIERVGGTILLLNIILIAIFVRLFVVRFVNPIAAISSGFEKFQQGLLAPQWRMKPPKSLAQIGELVRWFNAFLDSMEKRAEADTRLRIAATAFEAQEGMLVTDECGIILQVNSAFTAMTGYSAEEAVGKSPRPLSAMRNNLDFYRALHQNIGRTDSWQGETWNRRKNGESYPAWLTITAVRNSDNEISHYVATLTDITQRKAAEKEIENLAFYDSLTHLPNRRLLMDRLKQALLSSQRTGRHGALMMLDLDNFKTVNDTLGHNMGDVLLLQVGQRLGKCVRENDTVARLGGDEFVVLLENLSTDTASAATQAESIGHKILYSLGQSYSLNGTSCHNTPSIGITLFSNEACALEEPLKQADIALYQAKEAGRNTLRFFDAAMHAAIMQRAELESSLREALARQQFLLHFQPQIDSQLRTIGAEVLVRWQHPQRGMVSPAAFIPLLEETGLIVPLGLWVLETACFQLKRWEGYAGAGHLSLAVNVSPRQFHHADFVNEVLQVLDRTGANPNQLKLELTESLLVEDVEGVIAKMALLKNEGVRFSLDDFGTGYSSLAHLKRLPLDQLKIDQSFVRDVLVDANDATIARTVIALGQSMGLDVIAEGVETEGQHAFLQKHGCHAFQGYLFSRPLPLEAFEAFLMRKA
ncbi:MAG: EAL domain-containing protein [Giesbergeria sp.]|nr:EAL domain-containing protein [Giesbergeria sp.]